MGTSLMRGLCWQPTRRYRDEVVSLVPAAAGSPAAAPTRRGGRRIPGTGSCGPPAGAGARPGRPAGRARGHA